MENFKLMSLTEFMEKKNQEKLNEAKGSINYNNQMMFNLLRNSRGWNELDPNKIINFLTKHKDQWLAFMPYSQFYEDGIPEIMQRISEDEFGYDYIYLLVNEEQLVFWGQGDKWRNKENIEDAPKEVKDYMKKYKNKHKIYGSDDDDDSFYANAAEKYVADGLGGFEVDSIYIDTEKGKKAGTYILSIRWN